ncbi:hypothetical protein MKK70_02930 [Methylobacterium sp. E-041]|uniref:hypothetical protein n=1 Tax=Methylobacterium sp. E-041 TaxID=2836573 RepID=UPI001FB98E74|nr:hypothetical protein [Methylobacterium sp. E-041]MCJ2104353.1 hypothetical protein [Methylobacterium sp. E-041]
MSDRNVETPTQTPETERAYYKRGQSLFVRATRETGVDPLTPLALVMWFLAAHRRWSRRTVRVYRASIRAFLWRLLQENPNRAGLILPALDLLATVADPLSQRLVAPEQTVRSKLTSANKRKHLTEAEADAIDRVLARLGHQYAALARGYLRNTCRLGLRPSEWPTARLVGRHLVVRNGKNMNGRANGEVRVLVLDEWLPERIEILDSFIAALGWFVKKHGWDRVHAGIRRALRAASIATGIPSLVRRPVTPYTCRHVAAARLKAVTDRAEVAAIMGHATDETASIHYAPRSAAKGWQPIQTRAAAGATASIRRTYREVPERFSSPREGNAPSMRPGA